MSLLTAREVADLLATRAERDEAIAKIADMHDILLTDVPDMRAKLLTLTDPT